MPVTIRSTLGKVARLEQQLEAVATAAADQALADAARLAELERRVAALEKKPHAGAGVSL